jgi:hypothetical protein
MKAFQARVMSARHVGSVGVIRRAS